MTPLLKMHTLGDDVIPDPLHSGGLRYHGKSSPVRDGRDPGGGEGAERVLRRRVLFARTGGSCRRWYRRMLAVAIDEALKCKESGEEKVIVTALCGHGHLDLPAYAAVLSGSVTDTGWEDEALQASAAEALTKLPALA